MAHRESGMTLLEVMVALAIFSTAALALMNTISVSTNYTGRLGDVLRASWVAENIIAEAHLASNKFSQEMQQGTVTMGGQQWRWQAQMVKDEAGKPANQVSVYAGEENASALVTLSDASVWSSDE
ncbi:MULTISPECIES: type II secretion system minor pseudopilin GspI [Atlantibacter]|uniref:type II secretion system minor pseudopilin GspI n=1 Tax=Atlantibacter TaxID=1903434 RepID=UPI00160611E9|nr:MULTISPECIES: type II secretion system minor pseudopilin GspI [Atlantibacter]MBB3320731.1 general secretion pathway protein I [Atlantibacter sp. RC6]MBL7637631.1 type II secretion system minor pseudopilin GspI [Atlantibacter hermannii]MBL7673853.1 type II secretion system minor pseudopilin GspI [Atlantibacter hermannii]MCZ7835227.1 type II secretion system minor pseudopilin GspI [Atlantibacter hermannii]